jgi:hypothetical protein
MENVPRGKEKTQSSCVTSRHAYSNVQGGGKSIEVWVPADTMNQFATSGISAPVSTVKTHRAVPRYRDCISK